MDVTAFAPQIRGTRSGSSGLCVRTQRCPRFTPQQAAQHVVHSERQGAVHRWNVRAREREANQQGRKALGETLTNVKNRVASHVDAHTLSSATLGPANGNSPPKKDIAHVQSLSTLEELIFIHAGF